MRLGLSSYTYAWAVGVPGSRPEAPLGARELVHRAAELGVGVVQICDNLPLHRLPVAEEEALIRHAADLGVEIEVGTRGIESDRLARYVRLAARYGSPILRLVAEDGDRRLSEEGVVDAIRQVLPELEGAGVRLALENHDRLPSRTLARIMAAIGSEKVGICLDTVNSFGALEGPEVVVRRLAPWVINLHVKDFCISRPEHNLGFVIEGRPAGQGRLDVPWLLRELDDRPHMSAIIELWTPPERTLAATIDKEARWAASSVSFMRTLIPD
jgi:sugar phosphate isomerase/epimerase